jgi:hypothetical protein
MTLPELLVATALLAVVLLAAVVVEVALLRRVRSLVRNVPGQELQVAVNRIERDVREAAFAERMGIEVEGEEGTVNLLVLRDGTGKPLAAYTMDGEGGLRRLTFNKSGTVRHNRVLLSEVTWNRLQPIPVLRIVEVGLRRADGTSYMGTFRMRSSPMGPVDRGQPRPRRPVGGPW